MSVACFVWCGQIAGADSNHMGIPCSVQPPHMSGFSRSPTAIALKLLVCSCAVLLLHVHACTPCNRVMVSAWPGQSQSEPEDWPSTNPVVSRQPAVRQF